jgi:rhodanese-related sulfurtransferase
MAASHVSAIAAAAPSEAAAHFAHKLSLETDCWDVHESLKKGPVDFVLLDVRGRQAFARGHVPGAISLPHADIIADRMMSWPHTTLFVVYCAGPHCNGADRAALRLAKLGRPVKIMIGGVTGWADEGFGFSVADEMEA